MDAGPRAALSIGDLAQSTGVPAPTLRSWESRYGFPRSSRQGGGHRRYAESEVEAVMSVLALRRSGIALPSAIERATAPAIGTGSLYADLRRRHPGLQPQVLSRRTLVAMSNAIEDECCARAASPLLFGGFQRGTFLRGSYDRWRELARTARRTVVFAAQDDPDQPALDGLVQVSLPHASPLNREWFVVCDAEDLPACLVATERPGAGATRTFEAVWSVDPVVVRDASLVAAGIADDLGADWRDGQDPVDRAEPVAASDDLHRATELFDRMVGYLDTALGRQR